MSSMKEQVKGLLYCFSLTGNTLAAGKALGAGLKNIRLEYRDMMKEDPAADLSGYDLVGVACLTDFFGPSRFVLDFIGRLPRQNGKPAFVFNTFGSISGRTLPALRNRMRRRGFRVLDGYSLRAPENYPPMIRRGMAMESSPPDRDLAGFTDFAERLDVFAGQLAGGTVPARHRISGGSPLSLLPLLPRKVAAWEMGKKRPDRKRCVECGVCARLCPYGAVTMDPLPVFDQSKCFGCWRCYNRCPQRAVMTRKFHGEAGYSAPLKIYQHKLQNFSE
jgi:ferredoxin/flavodoxin